MAFQVGRLRKTVTTERQPSRVQHCTVRDAVLVVRHAPEFDPPLTGMGDLGITRYSQVHSAPEDDTATQRLACRLEGSVGGWWLSPRQAGDPAWLRSTSRPSRAKRERLGVLTFESIDDRTSQREGRFHLLAGVLARAVAESERRYIMSWRTDEDTN